MTPDERGDRWCRMLDRAIVVAVILGSLLIAALGAVGAIVVLSLWAAGDLF